MPQASLPYPPGISGSLGLFFSLIYLSCSLRTSILKLSSSDLMRFGGGGREGGGGQRLPEDAGDAILKGGGSGLSIYSRTPHTGVEYAF